MRHIQEAVSRGHAGWPRLLRTIASEPQGTQLAKRICQDLVEGFGFSRALIATVDEKHNCLTARAGYDPNIPATVYMALLRMYRVPLAARNDGRFLMAAWSAHHQQQAFVPDASRDSFRPAEATQRPFIIKALGTPSYVITPIVYRGRTVAVFAVDKKGQTAPINDAELEELRDVANVLAARFGSLMHEQFDGDPHVPLPFHDARPTETHEALFQGALHDLKAPMQSILGFAELLQSGHGGALTAEQTEFVARIVTGGEELLELIDRLLTIHHLEARRHDGSADMIVAGLVVNTVVERLRGKALRAHVNISTAIAEDVPQLHGDWTQLSAVFQNLLANAIDAARPGDTVHISGTCDSDSRFARFAVSQIASTPSTEPGEPPFDPDWSNASRRRSHGLGLAIVTRIVKSYGGELWAEGEPGAFFSIGMTLPVFAGTAEVA